MSQRGVWRLGRMLLNVELVNYFWTKLNRWIQIYPCYWIVLWLWLLKVLQYDNKTIQDKLTNILKSSKPLKLYVQLLNTQASYWLGLWTCSVLKTDEAPLSLVMTSDMLVEMTGPHQHLDIVFTSATYYWEMTFGLVEGKLLLPPLAVV